MESAVCSNLLLLLLLFAFFVSSRQHFKQEWILFTECTTVECNYVLSIQPLKIAVASEKKCSHIYSFFLFQNASIMRKNGILLEK